MFIRKLLCFSALTLVIPCFSVAAFAADGNHKDNDAWSWIWLGTVNNPPHMFPNTEVDKFRDPASGVICYVYANKNVSAKTVQEEGHSIDAVADDALGTMSCVSERR